MSGSRALFRAPVENPAVVLGDGAGPGRLLRRPRQPPGADARAVEVKVRPRRAPPRPPTPVKPKKGTEPEVSLRLGAGVADGARDALGQFARRERLEDDRLHAGLVGLGHDLAGAVRGDHHDAHAGPDLPRTLDEFEAAQLGHLVIHHEELGRLGGQMRQRLVGAREAMHGVPLGLEHLHAHAHDGWLVIHHHDGHEAAPRLSSARSLYSTESTSARHDASMMLLATPTVPHVSRSSPEVMSTRVLAAVPFDSSRMRTL